MNCDVERIVYSHTFSPVSRYDSASGMKSTDAAFSSADIPSPRAARSWKSELKFMIWIPVRRYTSCRGIFRKNSSGTPLV